LKLKQRTVFVKVQDSSWGRTWKWLLLD